VVIIFLIIRIMQVIVLSSPNVKDFWKAKDTWFPTWQNPSDPSASSLRIKSVKMWQEQDTCPPTAAEITASQNAAITATQNAAVTASQNAAITTSQNAAITATRNAAITATRNAAITATRNAAITATRNAAITATRNAAITATRNAAITATRNAAITATQNAAVTASQNAAITAAQNAAITASQNAAITATQNAAMTASQNAAITASQNAAITAAASITAAIEASLTSAANAASKTSTYCSVLDDEFASGTIESSNWSLENTMSSGFNNQFQWYTTSPNNSFVNNATLYLKPTLTFDSLGSAMIWAPNAYDIGVNCTDSSDFGCSRTANGLDILPPIQSAKITTKNTVSLKYGKVEIIAKMPKGDFLWPSISFLPKTSKYGAYPMSGQIDLLETRGNAPATCDPNDPNCIQGSDRVETGLHWGPDSAHDEYAKTQGVYYMSNRTSLSNDFHTYGFVWTNESFISYIDSPANVIANVPLINLYAKGNFDSSLVNPWISGSSSAPFDQEFYLVMSVAVGSNSYFGPDRPGKPWTNSAESGPLDFWKAKSSWYPSWLSAADPNSNAMAVKSVKMWKQC
jgi:hypothetical protein